MENLQNHGDIQILNKESFFAANRNVSLGLGALTVCASWLWGIALLVSSQQAYLGGISQFLLFAVPNVLALVLFMFISLKIRDVIPHGYTILDLIKERGASTSVVWSYKGITLFTELYSFVVQLTAASLLSSLIFPNVTIFYLTISLAFFMLCGVFLKGLIGGVNLDSIKMWAVGLLFLICISVILIALGKDIFDQIPSAKMSFEGSKILDFGIPISISLLSGVVISNQVWQRNIALESSSSQAAFFWGILLFWAILFMLGVLGLIATSIPMVVPNTQLVGIQTLNYFYPEAITFILVMFILALVVTGSSALNSFGALVSQDIPYARVGMVFICVIGTGVALFQIPLILMLQFLGIRAAFFFPTLNYIYSDKRNDWTFSRDLLFTILVAISFYLLAFFVIPDGRWYAALGALILPGIYILKENYLVKV